MTSIGDFAAEMWNRNRYGIAATAMVKDNPWFGIGVGTYPTMALDYVADGPLQPDNAQNWLRHEVVEFGLIGSLGWVVWFLAFAVFVFRVTRTDRAGLWITRGMLIAFGAVSMFGMPGQAIMVAVTFWAVVFWHLSFRTERDGNPFVSRWTWVVAVLIAVVAGAGTAWQASGKLRVPARARASTWPYAYGFAAPQSVENEEGYRRARSHALAVLDARSRWLSVSVRPDPQQDGGQPVDVRVWADGGTVLKAQLRSRGPLTAIVELPTDRKRVLLEAAGRRLDSHRPFFVRDAEALYFLKWEFLDHPPADFNGAGYYRISS
jgi:O-antigen ligase